MTAYTSFEDVPRKRYGVVLADPPWRFKTYAPQDMATTRTADRHYPTMDLEAIKALPVREIAGRDCYLMLWCSWPHLLNGLAVMKAWGFTYSSDFKVWLKLKESFSPTRAFISVDQVYSDIHTGTGYTTRKNTEFILLGRRGSPKRQVKNEHEVMIAPVREHSRKPDETIAAVERYAVGPYLEMFARAERPGWDLFDINPPSFRHPEPEPKHESEPQPEVADLFEAVDA